MAAAIPAVIIGLTAVSAGAQIYSGISANAASKKEASALRDQGQLASDEANAEAASHAQDVRRFAANQSLAFLSNGVSMAGSPLLVLDDTITQGQNEVNSIVKSGDAQKRLYNQRADNTRNQGRAALIGSIGGAAGTVAGTAVTGKQAGLWK